MRALARIGRSRHAARSLRLPTSRSLAPLAPSLSRGFRASAARADVKIADLHKLSEEALVAEGYSKAEAAVLLDVMMWAQLRGYGAGVSEIAGGAVAKSGAAGMIEVGLETKLSAKVDGHQSNGMLVLHKAVGIAVEKAKAHGMALVGTANMSSSAGALGYYLETIAQQGLVGLVLAQSPQMVAPFCQNPIGVAVPSARGPVVVDLASAAHTLFGLASADAPAVSALEGAIATFDKGYQGSQLSLMCELLANPILEAPDHAVRRAPATRPRSALPPPSPPASLATTASHLPRPTSHPLAGPPRPRLRPRAARREGQVPPRRRVRRRPDGG